MVTTPRLARSQLFGGSSTYACAAALVAFVFWTQALPLILLYRQERTQYDMAVQKQPGKSPSEIYGAEHLLRVFGEKPALALRRGKKTALIAG